MAVLSLIAKLGLDGRGFQSTLSAAGQQVKSFGSELSPIKSQLAGVFSAAAVGVWLNSIKQAVLEIKDLSEQFGLTTENVQELQFVASQSGLQFQDFANALNKMNDARAAAVGGNDEMERKFRDFGISLSDLQNPAKSDLDILRKIAATVSQIQLTPQQKSDLKDLLGNKSAKLSGAINDLGNGKVNPFIIPDDYIQKIDLAEKKVQKLGLAFRAMGASVMAGAVNIAQKFAPGGGMGLVEKAAEKAKLERQRRLDAYKDLSDAELADREKTIQALLDAELKRSDVAGETTLSDQYMADSQALQDVQDVIEQRRPGVEQRNKEKDRRDFEINQPKQKELSSALLELQQKQYDLRLKASTQGDDELDKITKRLRLQREINNLLVAASEYDTADPQDQAEAAKLRSKAVDKASELLTLSKPENKRYAVETLTENQRAGAYIPAAARLRDLSAPSAADAAAQQTAQNTAAINAGIQQLNQKIGTRPPSEGVI